MNAHPNLTTVKFANRQMSTFFQTSTLNIFHARLVLKQLGFEVLTVQKGIFTDGHERQDIIIDASLER